MAVFRPEPEPTAVFEPPPRAPRTKRSRVAPPEPPRLPLRVPGPVNPNLPRTAEEFATRKLEELGGHKFRIEDDERANVGGLILHRYRSSTPPEKVEALRRAFVDYLVRERYLTSYDEAEDLVTRLDDFSLSDDYDDNDEGYINEKILTRFEEIAKIKFREADHKAYSDMLQQLTVKTKNSPMEKDFLKRLKDDYGIGGMAARLHLNEWQRWHQDQLKRSMSAIRLPQNEHSVALYGNDFPPLVEATDVPPLPPEFIGESSLGRPYKPRGYYSLLEPPALPRMYCPPYSLTAHPSHYPSRRHPDLGKVPWTELHRQYLADEDRFQIMDAREELGIVHRAGKPLKIEGKYRS